MSTVFVGQLLLAFVAGVVLLGGYSFVDDAARHYGPLVAAWIGGS